MHPGSARSMAQQAGEQAGERDRRGLGQAAHSGAMQQESQAHLRGKAAGEGALICGGIKSTDPRLGGLLSAVQGDGDAVAGQRRNHRRLVAQTEQAAGRSLVAVGETRHR